MRPQFGAVLVVIFCLSEARAQQSVPVFKTKEDSTSFADLQQRLTAIRNLSSTATPGSRAYDSLMTMHGALIQEQMKFMTTRMVRMRTIYRSDPFMTSYAEMLKYERPSEVRKLSIEGNGRSRLPDSLYLCENLEELELVNWKLARLPRNLSKLRNLREVTILNNQPSSPLKLSRNRNIRDLTIRGDEANGRLPRRYSSLRNLEVLDLSRNNLSRFPNITGSRDLKKVSLVFNELTLEDLRGRQPSAITEINLANNKIRTVPGSISRFKSVRKLNFNNNLVDSISPAISSLRSLEEISLYNNKLAKFPEAVYSISNLRVIDLYYNQISYADKRLGHMKSLEILYLANNRFFTLPDNLGQLSGLKELYVHHNRLSALPESVGQLKGLTVLRVNDNQLLEFPAFLLGLDELQNLDISHNQIQELQTDGFNYRNLKIFALVGNPWDETTRQALPEFATKLRKRNTVVHLNTYEDGIE